MRACLRALRTTSNPAAQRRNVKARHGSAAKMTCSAYESHQGRHREATNHRPVFDARISGLSICGAFENKSFALANSALAISPFKCALRPFSSAKVSKMPYFPGPIFTAYQLTVPASRSAIGCADFRNSSTSFSFPGLASSCAQIESNAIGISSCQSDACRTRLDEDHLNSVSPGFVIPRSEATRNLLFHGPLHGPSQGHDAHPERGRL